MRCLYLIVLPWDWLSAVLNKMINLLPPQQKAELGREEKWKLILILGIISLIFFLYLSLILLALKIYISSELESQKILLGIEEKKFKASEIQEFQKKVVALNQNLSKLDSFYREQTDLTNIIEKISNLLPSEVYLTNLSWQKETSQIGLSGSAPLRENLFELKKNLEKDFEEVYFPASNWVKPKDIDFSVTFKVKSSK